MVDQGVDIDCCWDGCVQVWYGGFDVFYGFDYVGIGLFGDGQYDGVVIVDGVIGCIGCIGKGLGGDFVVFWSVDGDVDVFDVDWCVIVLGQDYVVLLFGFEQLIVGIDGEGLVCVIDCVFGLVYCGGGDDVVNVFQVDVQCSDFGWIDLDVYGWFLLVVYIYQVYV